ncbi:protein kinase [Acidicapsa dinghuensis]|uniref:Protein kinase n=1 Tax=Acidicapsa dinghuensis TaxID=2218256 RepID=A0ABW1EL16_9BACT|nr:serine/threonine-protein kinase [Acidicapsa dinghuensis]
MTPDRWKTVNEIFHAALELPEAERGGYVTAASGGDRLLEQDVLSLLKADSQAEDYLEIPLLGYEASENPYFLTPPLAAGDILERRFQIVRCLGSGGMGHVFEAVDTDLKMRVAVKVIRPEIAANPVALEYFRREVRFARTITHTNVCRTYEFDKGWASRGEEETIGELYFLTMECIDGETLAARIQREGKLTPTEAREVAVQIASGLNSAHAAGVIHRDIKPGNIMLVEAREEDRPPRAVLMDFGLARRDPIHASGSDSGFSQAGMAGTFAYMAPEQMESDNRVSPAADIYAFGLVLYEMVTGRRAFPTDSLLNSVAQRLSGAIPSARKFTPDLSEAWERAIEGCLRPVASDRFQSVEEVIEVLEGRGAAQVATLLQKAEARSGRHKRRIWIAAGVVCLCIVSLFGAWFRIIRQEANATVASGSLVYLTPVRNQTGHKELDNLTELFRASLSQSVQINLLDQGRIGDALQWMTKPPDTVIDAPTAREIAMRTGAHRVVFASVTGSGRMRQLNIDIEQPGDSPERSENQWRNTFSWQEASAPSETIPPELLSAVRNASEWVRSKAGESKKDIAQFNSLPGDITTANWHALEQFVYATSLDMKGDAEGARKELSQAVQTDPSFALAYARMADIDYELGHASDGFAAYQRALDPGLSVRLTRRERDRILGMFAIDTMDFSAANAAFRDYTSFYGSDYAGWAYRSYPLMMLGRMDEAIDALHTAMQMDPNRHFAPEMLARYLLIEGRYGDAALLIGKIRALGDGTFADAIQGQLSFLRMNMGQAEQAFAQITNASNRSRQAEGHALLARLWAERGEYEKALAELSINLESNDTKSNLHELALRRVDIAYVDMQLGRDSESLRNLKEAVASDSDLYVLFNGIDILDMIATRNPKPRVRQEIKSILTLLVRWIHKDEESVADTILRARVSATKALLLGNAVKAEKAFREADQLMAPAVPRTSFAVFHLAAARQAGDVRQRDRATSLALAAYKVAADRPESIWGRPLQFPPGYYLASAKAYLQLAKKLQISDASTKVCKERMDKFLSAAALKSRERGESQFNRSPSRGGERQWQMIQ